MRVRLLIVISLVLTGCIHINNDRPTFNDPEIGMIIRVANLAEVREGTLAREKAADPAVRDFGAMMVTEHSAASSKAESELFKAEIDFADSPISRELDAESGAVTERLRALSGRAFDRAYMDRQVQAHQNALTLIDTKLMPTAKKKVLKEQLTEMRKLVETHLAKAKQIASTLPAA